MLGLNVGTPLLLVQCATYLQVICITAYAAQSYFEKSAQWCSGSGDPYASLPSRSSLECAFLCAEQDGCAAYQRVNDSRCFLYGWSARDLNNCTSGKSISIYLKQSSLCQNGATLASDGVSCKCINGYVGSYCEKLMEDCSDGYTNGGYRTDEKYWTQPLLAPVAFQVRCQMSQGAGLTLIQMRTSADVDFNRTWREYKSGFQITDGKDFWLGNSYIHWITSSSPQILMVQLSSGTYKRYQYYYNGFKMGDEEDNYAVTYLNGWSNNNTDSKKYMSPCWPGTSINFSTWDKDNDGNDLNCAQIYGAGFWFTGNDDCTLCNPNGKLSPGQNDRLYIPSENFWTPNLGDWTPDAVVMVLFRKK